MNCVSVLSFQRTIKQDIILRLAADEFMLLVMPGQYINCGLAADAVNVIPAYIFSVNQAARWIEIFISHHLYERLSLKIELKKIFITDLLGDAFVLSDGVNRPLLIADESGLPAIIFFAGKIKAAHQVQPLVLLYSEESFPFTPVPSQFVVSNFPAGVLAACPLLEDKRIPSRLICENLLPGCYDGNIAECLDELPDAFFDGENSKIYAIAEKKTLDQISVFSQRRELAIHCICVI